MPKRGSGVFLGKLGSRLLWPTSAPPGRHLRLSLLLVACFLALVAAVYVATPRLLQSIVDTDGTRLALEYLAFVDREFDLPGTPAPPSMFYRTLETLVLPASNNATVDEAALFSPSRFNRDQHLTSLTGYVVFARHGGRLFAGGRPQFRSTETPPTKAWFETAMRSGSVTVHRTNGMDAASPQLAVIIPLLQSTTVEGVAIVEVNRSEIAERVRTGIERSVLVLATSVLAVAFLLLGFVSILQNRHRKASEHATYLSHYDPLTGLKNRASFHDEIGMRCNGDAGKNTAFALGFIDVCAFSHFNSTFGLECGDALLKSLAQRLTETLAEDPDLAECNAILGRHGADEFVFMFTSPTRNHLELFCERLIGEIGKSINAGNFTCDVDVAVGAAQFPFDGDTAETLVANAQFALKMARQEQPNTARIFDAEVSAFYHRESTIAVDLPLALQRGEISMHYQPQVVMTHEGPMLHGFESLVRWTHPELGPISPAEFVPVAERTGLIVELGNFSLREVCAEAVTWPRAGDKRLTVAVNLSPAQLVGPGEMGDSPPPFDEVVREVLLETGFPPEQLEFEITEGLPVESNQHVQQVLENLQLLGVGIAIDDFGTGYSSLSYLPKLGANKLKLDRAFVRQLVSEPQVRSIVGALVHLCGELGMILLAEGVESDSDEKLLLQLGCYHFQGYHYGKAEREPDFSLLEPTAESEEAA